MKKKLLYPLHWTLLLFMAVVSRSFSQTPYIGEVRLFAGNYAPNGWAECNGQLLSIAEYDTLYALIGTTYGGDGVTDFAVPNLQGRVVVGQGQSPGTGNYVMGEMSGQEHFRVNTVNIPSHYHIFNMYNAIGNQVNAANHTLAVSRSIDLNRTAKNYTNNLPNAALHPATVGSQHYGQSLDNRQPSTGIMHIIALYGVFPSQG